MRRSCCGHSKRIPDQAVVNIGEENGKIRGLEGSSSWKFTDVFGLGDAGKHVKLDKKRIGYMGLMGILFIPLLPAPNSSLVAPGEPPLAFLQVPEPWYLEGSAVFTCMLATTVGTRTKTFVERVGGDRTVVCIFFKWYKGTWSGALSFLTRSVCS